MSRSRSLLWFCIAALNVCMTPIVSICRAETQLSGATVIGQIQASIDLPSSAESPVSVAEDTTKPEKWTVPIQELAHLSHVNVGREGPNSPYIMDDDFLLRVPIPVGNGFYIINSLESRNRTFVYTQSKPSSAQRKLTDLHFLNYSLSLRFPQNKTWSHVVTAGWGYGGDYRSFSSAEGSKYTLSYLAMWYPGQDLEIGFGVALGRFQSYFIPVPIVLLKWQIVNDLMLKVTFPKELVLRYSLNRIWLFGVFGRLNGNQYYVSEEYKTTDAGQLRMKDGGVSMLRIDMGPEMHVKLYKFLYLRLEGGVSFATKVELPKMILTDKTAQQNVIKQQFGAHWTWFAGGGFSAIF